MAMMYKSVFFGIPDTEVDLKPTMILWTHKKHAHKNYIIGLFHLKTFSYNEYMIECDLLGTGGGLVTLLEQGPAGLRRNTNTFKF